MTTYEPQCGEHIERTANAMVALAMQAEQTITAKFNDIELTADATTDPASIVARFSSECEARSKAYRDSPAGIEAERRAAEFREQAARAEAEGIKSFTVKNAEFWNSMLAKNPDPFGMAVLRYAARLAHMCEESAEAVTKGPYFQRRTRRMFTALVRRFEFTADSEGLSGAMAGMARATLRKAWQHGKAI